MSDQSDRSSSSGAFRLWILGLPGTTWAFAGGVILLLLTVSARYGFHRDELYFVVAGRRLAWGYIDQPPLTPVVARIADLLPGAVSPTALRLVPAVSASLVVILAAVLAKRFGGDRIAVAAASGFAAVGGFYLAVGHLLSTATFDVMLWAAVIVLVSALVDGVDPRWWLGVGVLVGVGMLNKHTIAALVVALIFGLVLTPQRKILSGPWPWVGAVLALLIAAPNLVWQASNGWPQIEMAASLRADADGPADYLLIQIAILSVFLVIPTVVGWWWLFANETGRRWRVFPIAFVFLFFLFFLTGGKGYYVAPLYLPLFAAGAIWVENKRAVVRKTVFGLIAFGAAFGVLLALPVVPPENADAFNEINNELGETYGWDQLVDQIEVVYLGLDLEAQSTAVIYTSNYGEAGAIEVIGADRLPPPISGHNNYWLWGPGDRQGPIIGVGQVQSHLKLVCPQVTAVSMITNEAGIDNEENGATIWLCLNPDAPLSSVWNEIRHFD